MKRFATVVLSGALAASFSQFALAQTATQPETRPGTYSGASQGSGNMPPPGSTATKTGRHVGAGGTAAPGASSREYDNPRESAWQACGDDDSVRCLNERAGRGQDWPGSPDERAGAGGTRY
ncbi:MAG: hypothetical protein ACT4P3_14345 [Betaproteobacteria bacterium]